MPSAPILLDALSVVTTIWSSAGISSSAIVMKGLIGLTNSVRILGSAVAAPFRKLVAGDGPGVQNEVLVDMVERDRHERHVIDTVGPYIGHCTEDHLVLDVRVQHRLDLGRQLLTALDRGELDRLRYANQVADPHRFLCRHADVVGRLHGSQESLVADHVERAHVFGTHVGAHSSRGTSDSRSACRQACRTSQW